MWGDFFEAEFLFELRERAGIEEAQISEMRKTVLIALADTWQRYREARGEGEFLAPAVGVALVESLLRPLRLSAGGKATDLSSREFSDYAMASINAMNQALRVPTWERKQ